MSGLGRDLFGWIRIQLLRVSPGKLHRPFNKAAGLGIFLLLILMSGCRLAGDSLAEKSTDADVVLVAEGKGISGLDLKTGEWLWHRELDGEPLRYRRLRSDDIVRIYSFIDDDLRPSLVITGVGSRKRIVRRDSALIQDSKQGALIVTGLVFDTGEEKVGYDAELVDLLSMKTVRNYRDVEVLGLAEYLNSENNSDQEADNEDTGSKPETGITQEEAPGVVLLERTEKEGIIHLIDVALLKERSTAVISDLDESFGFLNLVTADKENILLANQIDPYGFGYRVLCLESATGKLLWDKQIGASIFQYWVQPFSLVVNRFSVAKDKMRFILDLVEPGRVSMLVSIDRKSGEITTRSVASGRLFVDPVLSKGIYIAKGYQEDVIFILSGDDFRELAVLEGAEDFTIDAQLTVDFRTGKRGVYRLTPEGITLISEEEMPISLAPEPKEFEPQQESISVEGKAGLIYRLRVTGSTRIEVFKGVNAHPEWSKDIGYIHSSPLKVKDLTGEVAVLEAEVRRLDALTDNESLLGLRLADGEILFGFEPVTERLYYLTGKRQEGGGRGVGEDVITSKKLYNIDPADGTILDSMDLR